MLNSNAVKKATEILGVLYTVIFSPYDIYLIKGDPGGRRRLIDTLISQISPSYLRALQNYRSILKQKNAILKKHPVNDLLLDTYNTQLAAFGAVLINERKSVVDTMQREATKIYNLFSRTKTKLMIYYTSTIEYGESGLEDHFMSMLNDLRRKEKERGTSLIGPHLDDITIELDAKSAKHFASEGQKRAIALSMRIAEYSVAKKIFNEPPVILMDDVFGELDNEKKAVLKTVLDPEAQLFFTCTDEQTVPSLIEGARKFRIVDGQIISSR